MLSPLFFLRSLLLLTLATLLAACGKSEPGTDIPTVKLNTEAYPQAQTLVVGASANQPDAPPFLNGWPTHVQVQLNDQNEQGKLNPREPQLRVFPVAAYTGIYREAERTDFERQLRQLKRITENQKTARPTTPVPVFPVLESPEVFHSQLTMLKTAQLQGVRFITRHSQEVTATTNEEIFYTFQGLSTDGRYYISFFHPITLEQLPETPFLDQSTAFIENADPRTFNPELTALDRLVESITITPSPKKP